jgi:ATP-dependent Clp protease ATP-binding subunit ClpA
VFERFSREARQVVTRAMEEAQQRGDARIGTEHLLIGVARSGTMTELMPDTDALRAELDRIDAEALESVGLDPGLLEVTAPAPQGGRGRSRHIPFTGGAKDILKGALREALGLGDRYIGVEHIALALTDVTGPDRAKAALSGLGVDTATLRASLLHHLREAS